jgi:hypothetical protein
MPNTKVGRHIHKTFIRNSPFLAFVKEVSRDLAENTEAMREKINNYLDAGASTSKLAEELFHVKSNIKGQGKAYKLHASASSSSWANQEMSYICHIEIDTPKEIYQYLGIT